MKFLRGIRKRWLVAWITIMMLAGVPALADFTLASFPITFGNEFARISGIVHIATGGVTNAMLQNASTTVNGTTCTLGSTCTPASTGITQLTGPVTAGPGSGSVATSVTNNAITNAMAAQMAANTIKGNPTGSTANASDMSVPSCADTGGNHLNWTSNSGFSCGTSDTTRVIEQGIGWPSGIDPAGNIIFTAPRAMTITAVYGRVTVPVGATATFNIRKVPSGTAYGSGSAITTATFNANGTANTNQVLTVQNTSVSQGDSFVLDTTNGSNWTSGAGVGGITVELSIP